MKLNDLHRVKAGDTVLLRTASSLAAPREVKVAKVGRTLIHVSAWGEGGRTSAYRIESGVSNDGFGQSRIETAAMAADREARAALMERLERAGWREVRFARGVNQLGYDDLLQVVELFERIGKNKGDA